MSFLIGMFVGVNMGLFIISLCKVNPKSCLHCGEGDAEYCETCYQMLLAENLKLQSENEDLKKENKEIYNHIPVIN